jgi:hypothetical protein
MVFAKQPTAPSLLVDHSAASWTWTLDPTAAHAADDSVSVPVGAYSITGTSVSGQALFVHANSIAQDRANRTVTYDDFCNGC